MTSFELLEADRNEPEKSFVTLNLKCAGLSANNVSRFDPFVLPV